MKMKYSLLYVIINKIEKRILIKKGFSKFLNDLTMTASVVKNRAAKDAAFCSVNISITSIHQGLISIYNRNYRATTTSQKFLTFFYKVVVSSCE